MESMLIASMIQSFDSFYGMFGKYDSDCWIWLNFEMYNIWLYMGPLHHANKVRFKYALKFEYLRRKLN